ncbi:nucleotidyltransferase domain-containing protein [Chitinibacteraceae bacterium HSL-7]
MSRAGDRGANVQLRQQIAHRAARMIAEDHIDDFGLAKKKAAKQLGVTESRNLPSNEEIEAALADYRSIYMPDHHDCVDELRRKALAVMDLLARFEPYLTGSVLTGVAGPHSDINLLVYSDDPKALELFLVNQQIEYEHIQPNPQARYADHPTLEFWFDGSPVHVHLRPRLAERQNQHERIRRAQLAALMSSSVLP